MSGKILTIDNIPYSFEPGETILDVARKNGINIPTLCHLAGTTPTGACRMCVVEVEKARNLVISCAVPAAEAMVVHTESERVIRSRKSTLELMMSSGDHNCDLCSGGGGSGNWSGSTTESCGCKGGTPSCPVEGNCRLQEYAYKYQVRKERFTQSATRYPLESVNPFIVRDFSRCIRCGRCVQACSEVQVNNAISQGYRGDATKIVTSGDSTLADSDCVFCGECVQTCPVGALVEKDARYSVRPWDVKKVRTTCSYCGVGCQMDLHTKNGQVVKVTGAEDAAPNFGRLCVKGRFGYDFINSEDRLKTPLIKENGTFREASWDEALGLIAEKLGAIKKEHGSDSLAVLASARITNEENYLAQKFARAVLGTNNVDHCARLCHASTVAGLAAAFGSGAMTNPVADAKNSDVILITGSNPTENHPVMGTYIKQAAKYGKTKIIVVDPRNIGIARFAAVRLSQRPGTDVAWINGLMQIIISEGLADSKFIEERTEDFALLKKEVETYTPEYVEQITGIPAADLQAAARLYAGAEAASIVYAMGITQHSTGTDNVKSLANLAMLCGNMGKPGGGVNPLRGQNNVQGACDLGSLPNVYPGYQQVADAAAREKFQKAWGVDLSPTPGLTVVEVVNAAETGKVKAVYIIGENPMVSDPDLNHTEACLKKLEFLVVQDIFLTETALMADVVLPSASFAEKNGTFTNTERKVLRVRKAVKAPGSARPDWDILADLGRRMGYESTYSDADAIFDEMSKLTPSYAGMSYARLEKEGLHWPCPTADHPGTPILHIGKFTRGLGKFHPIKFLPPAEVPDSDYPLILTTGRILYHYHTGTMTMQSKGLNERAPECFIEISNRDAEKYGITEDARVEIMSRRGKISAVAHVSDKMMEGTVFIPFHYAQNAANRLTNAALDPVCKIPELKACAVKVSPAPGKAAAKKKWGQLDIRNDSRAILDSFKKFLQDEGKSGALEKVNAVLKANRHRRGAIIPVLQAVQDILGFLPPVVQAYISQGLNLPGSEVYGIISFYAFFTQKPRGKHMIKVCMGTACYVMGAKEIADKFEEVLQIKIGETTPDRVFTLEIVRCLGACGLAPVVMVDDDTYGGMLANKVLPLVEKYRNTAIQAVQTGAK